MKCRFNYCDSPPAQVILGGCLRCGKITEWYWCHHHRTIRVDNANWFCEHCLAFDDAHLCDEVISETLPVKPACMHVWEGISVTTTNRSNVMTGTTVWGCVKCGEKRDDG